MKTKIRSYLHKIKVAAYELQTYSYTEFQKILPAYLNNGNELNYSLLDKYFEDETGISLKEYFRHMKAQKASELLHHYNLSPVEAAYQLGFRTPSSLKRIMGFRNQYSITRIQYSAIHRRQMNMPKYI